ncbi:MAG: hypothetical protein B6D56_07385 [Candidatus Omnitrophica bacterium 4484_70.1]|nr:MAG: hypothetical protein B6D56_07385 [Candidatus Omnitrophica bacterium 4484_70.1]
MIRFLSPLKIELKKRYPSIKIAAPWWIGIVLLWIFPFFCFPQGVGKEGKKTLKELLKSKLTPDLFKQEVPVMTFRVKRIRNFAEKLPVLGMIVAFEEVKLSFPERGVVKNLFVEEGDTIEKGELLGELDEKEFVLKKEFAKSKYEAEYNLLVSMQKEYVIKKALYEEGAILKEKLEELEFKIKSQESKVEAAKKEWELAEESLRKIKLFSPCAGKIDKKETEEGEYVSPEKPVFTILKIDKVFAEIGVTERDIPKIKRGLIAHLEVDSYPGEIFEGRITNVLPSIKGASRTLTIKIEVDNKKYGYKLFPGMFVRGNLILIEVENAYVIPTETLIKNPLGEYTLLTITPSAPFTEEELMGRKVTGKIHLKKVEVRYKGEIYSVVKGVKEGELVIVRSQAKITPEGSIGKIINVEEFEGGEEGEGTE